MKKNQSLVENLNPVLEIVVIVLAVVGVISYVLDMVIVVKIILICVKNMNLNLHVKVLVIVNLNLDAGVMNCVQRMVTAVQIMKEFAT
jgi:hypothetical protein